MQELHNDLKKAEQLQMSNLSPELQESIEQLKAAAQSVTRPYQVENEIRPPRPEPVAQAEPVTPVEPAVQLSHDVPPVNSQRESESVSVSDSAVKGEVKP